MWPVAVRAKGTLCFSILGSTSMQFEILIFFIFFIFFILFILYILFYFLILLPPPKTPPMTLSFGVVPLLPQAWG